MKGAVFVTRRNHTMSETCIIAIDHGTSGVKTALATTRGEIVDFEVEKSELIFTPDGGVEQDAEQWWEALVRTVRRIVGKSAVPAESIEAVCCSSTFSSTVAVDENAKPLMNALTWMDARGAPYVADKVKGLINIEGYAITKLLRWLPRAGGGPGLSGKDDIGHVLLVKNKFPDIYAKTHKFLGSKDYLNARLTGQFAASYDSISLFWITDNRDINNIHYDNSLIRGLGVDASKFPPLKKSTDILGTITTEFAAATGLKPETKVVIGAADLQSACVGSGAVRDFEAHIYIGTSSWILCHVPFKKTDPFHIIAALPSAIPGRYFCANEQEIAGRTLDFLVNNLLYHKNELRKDEPPEDVFEKLDAIAARVPAGSHGVIYTPWLNGEKTPVENHTLRAGFHNMSLTTNMDHLIRAMMEGVAYNSRWVLGYVEKFVKNKLDPINIIGGGALSDAWCQIYADVLGRTIRRVKNPIQSNARGAAYIAAAALGYISFDDITDLIQYSGKFEPNTAARKVYDELFNEFLRIYKNNKAMYRRLNV